MSYQKKGRNIMFFLGTGTEKNCVALATNHTINLTPQFDETKTKDDEEGPGAPRLDYVDWDGTVESLLGTSATSGTKTYTDLVAAVIAGTSLKILTDAVDPSEAGGAIPSTGFTPADDADVFPTFFQGDCLISELTIDAGESGAAKMSCKFVANSELI